VGEGKRGAAAPGSQVQGATKWVVKMDILNAKRLFFELNNF
jgi:hypothetical protein